jgi:hypothetical protein
MGLVATGGSQASLTSNSQFLFVGTTLYIVTNSNTSGIAQILMSTDYGVSFTTVQTIAGLSAEFDPAIALDVNGVIHIVGTIYTAGLASLKLWRYTPAGNTLAGPFAATSGSNIGGDYDIIADSNGNSVIAASLLNAQGYMGENIVVLTVNPAGTIINTATLMSSPFQSGNTFGQVCLLTEDGVNFELYIGSHPKSITFKDFPLNIQLLTYTAGVWSSGTSLYVGSGRYVSDKMTVIADGANRYFSHCIYSQNRYGLSGNLLLGYSSSGPTGFSWKMMNGSPTASYSEPTLSVAPEGVSLAYIVRDYTQPTQVAGPVVINSMSLPSFTLTAAENFRYQTTATYLRGTTLKLPASVFYGVVAEAMPSGTTNFYCGYDSPPVPNVSPTAETIQRNTPYTLSGIGTTDATLDNLVFTWTSSSNRLQLTPNGYECVVLLPLTAGPSAQTITVTMSVTAVDNNGNPLHAPVTATSTLTVLQISAPVITAPATAHASRNSSFTLTPTVTYTGGYPLTYSWTQTVGTQLTAQSLTAENLTFYTNGSNINGETVVWVLTVSDGINDPVSQAFDVAIAAYNFSSIPSTYYNISQRPANLAQRNVAVGATWPVINASVLSTEFTKKRLSMTTTGGLREVLLNPYSVLVYTPLIETIGAKVVHRRLLPPTQDTFLDVVQTESDYTLVLTEGGWLYQYLPLNYSLINDNPAYSLNLATYSGFTFTNLVCGYSYANVRVVVLSGPEGCLLLQFANSPFTLTSTLELSVKTGFVYGSSDVLWVRVYNTENLNTGQVFLGTVDGSGNTYETLVDLSSRRIVGTWDATQLTNQTVTTGEFLLQTPDTYGGVPLAPVITGYTSVANKAQLTWTQDNAALAQGYTVYSSLDGSHFSPVITILNGAIQYCYIAGLSLGVTYHFYVVTNSLDGSSSPSATVTLTPTS